MISSEQLRLYFRRGIHESTYSSQLSTGAKLYLENLLFYFLQAEHFVIHESETLVGLLREAVDSQDRTVKKTKFNTLADKCLFIVGCFEGQLSRNFKNPEYCIEIGSGAYAETASLVKQRNKEAAQLFHELGNKFARSSSVIAETLAKKEMGVNFELEELARRFGSFVLINPSKPS